MLYIRDDLGYAWSFDGNRIFLVSAERELAEQNGYYCNSWEEGIAILNRDGYITEEYQHERAPWASVTQADAG